jgi:hypothetical protein
MHDQEARIAAQHLTPQLLTDWRVNDRHDQQAIIAAMHHSHSHTGETRMGIISRIEL